MYHYVRDLENSKYPGIKGLDVRLFREQVKYILKYYEVVRMEDVLDAVSGGPPISRNALLMTFDDGYADHFHNVLPVLDEFGLQGSFFPPGQSVREGRILDVNKIYYVLASADPKDLVEAIFAAMDDQRSEYQLEPTTHYLAKALAAGDRWDSPDVVLIKTLLQEDLPDVLRAEILDGLFSRYVSSNEADFASDIYMNEAQLCALLDGGMYVGSHGWSHRRLSGLAPSDRDSEIDLSLSFLADLGCDTSRWVMCYPYGDQDEELTRSIRSRGCVLGLTTQLGLANMRELDPMLVPRLDTNDLPFEALAAPVGWTQMVQEPGDRSQG